MSENEIFTFDIDLLEKLANEHHNEYEQAYPFKHMVFDDFLPESVADAALEDFPDVASNIWLDWRKRDTVHQPKKQGIGHASRLQGVPPRLLSLLNSFNSYPFLNF